MGGNASAEKRTHEQKISAIHARSVATSDIKQKLDIVVDDICNAKTNNSITNQDFAKAIAIAETAKTQLSREGEALTKADLIAIIIALNPGYMQHLSALKSNTVKDLNALIRTIIYDPTKYINTPSSVQPAPIAPSPTLQIDDKKSSPPVSSNALVSKNTQPKVGVFNLLH